MVENETAEVPMNDVEVGESDKSGVRRDIPDPDASRRNLVSEWQTRILDAKKFREKDFKQMKKNMQLAYAGADKAWIDSGKFVVPIVNRHINQAVSTLYAKNPTVAANIKKKMDFVVWDGEPESLKAAMASVQEAMMPQVLQDGTMLPSSPPDPQAVAILQEVQEVKARRLMLKRIGQTMEILLRHYIDEQGVGFKKQVKQLVRRAKVCSVGYGWLAYQRLLEKRPDITTKIADISEQLARMDRLSADIQDGVVESDSGTVDELKSMLADLHSQQEAIVREGPVFDFPRSFEIIIDKKCKQLNGLIGAGWIAREFHLEPSEIQELWKVDVRQGYKPYRCSGTGESEQWAATSSKKNTEDNSARVWEVWCKSTGQTFILVEGYGDFITEPAAPAVKLERFWPLFTLVLNDIEHDTELYPRSDVQMLEHTAMEYNRSREMRRMHRKANAPFYVSVKGRLSEDDRNRVSSRQPFDLVELNSLAPGEDVGAMIQVLKPAPMDSALYETNSEMEDIFRTVGSQEANLGGSSNATATEVSVGESSKATSDRSNADDLDEFLSELIRATGQMLLLTLDIETVKKIAGPGAVWPQISRSEIVEELDLDIKAGSSGRPNRAAELANMERAMPMLMQMNGVPMTPFAEKYVTLLEMDPTEFIVEGMPSQVALNAMAAKMGVGNPAAAGTGADPSMQGQQGSSNASGGNPMQNEPGPQPGYTQPGELN